MRNAPQDINVFTVKVRLKKRVQGERLEHHVPLQMLGHQARPSHRQARTNVTRPERAQQGWKALLELLALGRDEPAFA